MNETNSIKNLFFSSLKYTAILSFIVIMQYIGGKQSGIIGVIWLLLATIPLMVVLWVKKNAYIADYNFLKTNRLLVFYYIFLILIQILHPLLFTAFKLGFPITQRVSFLLFLPFELFLIIKILKNK